MANIAERKPADLDRARPALADIAAKTVAGLGLELVEIERSAGGLLRITIDVPWTPGQDAFVSVEDCEQVTRQLQYTLEVEGVDYKRLEVSSPGLDRPLRTQRDFERFVGEVVDVTLKAPIGAELAGRGAGALSPNRKKFRGVLARGESGWELRWRDQPPAKPGQRVSAKRQAAPEQVLGFGLDELKEARLASVVDFKGRRPRVVSGESE